MGVFYDIDSETGNLIPVEYEDGNIVLGIKGGLPSGRYIDRDGLKIRIGRPIGPSNFGGSDSLGVNGMLSMADGKRYDSKSEYYRSLKSQGLEIADRTHGEYKRPEVKIDEKRFDAAFKKTMEQLNV